ncbi:Extracellular solute-binding protein family 1 [Nostocoides australiense Ben110]|uniref:Extracellular solute-binding protein family 1 n=1 Tax=Nostocoides australiense Ben110 TaxID=1193182 RepID=W6K0C3_9MICO|nr:sugar ABC transporter substrate-binding protein [Tetrasphaera australiensis]CCH71774.1 Extracellular solute-binding protein family 1 [Tetrasphaera australiensis Ben110]
MSDLSRRAVLGAGGLAAAGLFGANIPRLFATDIPGRGDDALTVAILGTNQDAEARQNLVTAFRQIHPDIKVRIQAVQGQDWSNFFAKILTMVAAGTPPDVCVVATEGAQLFADRLAEPLDTYVQRDKDVMQDYFDDVHPSLVEAFMYKGNLYQLPIDFNAANIYYNTGTFEKAGVDRPADTWTTDDFLRIARQLRQGNDAPFVPFYWTNRLWGGCVPWLYINDTSFLKETKAAGGDWLWSTFYADDPAAAGRSGGYLWEESNALDPKVEESFEFLRTLVSEGLGTSPAQGGGNELVAQFAGGSIGMTPAGGFWVQGLSEAGMKENDFDVQFFPKWASQHHQLGAAGYAIMRTSKRKDEAWEWVKFCTSREGMHLAFPTPNTTPTRRSMCNAQLYAGKGPQHWQVFYDTLDKVGASPIPAPPQQAAVDTALIKNVLGAVTAGSRQGLRGNLQTLDRDLTLALGRS